jgi:hypothetical protein
MLSISNPFVAFEFSGEDKVSPLRGIFGMEIPSGSATGINEVSFVGVFGNDI